MSFYITIPKKIKKINKWFTLKLAFEPIWSSKLCLGDILSVGHFPKDLACNVGTQCRSATTVTWWHFVLSSQDCWRLGGDGGLRFNVFNAEQSSLKYKSKKCEYSKPYIIL